MKTIIKNGKIITRDTANPFIENGAVVFEDERIVAVGDSNILEKEYADADVIDAKGRMVMPGFINAHMHYYSTFARGINFNSKPATMFADILTGLWWKLDKMLDMDDVYYSAIGPMIDGIRMGVTTMIDHHASPNNLRGSLFTIAEAANKIGIRSNLCYEVSDRDGEQIALDGIEENIDFIKHCQNDKNDMTTGLVGMHAQLTVSQKTMDILTNKAEMIQAGYHIHAAEGIEDVVDAIAKYDRRVIERLNDNGILNDRSIAVHCVHITESEIELLAKSGVAVVNNPESNMSNAVGTSPVLAMLKAGVLVGMGTDGYCVDMTESLRGVHAIQKLVAGRSSVAWTEPHDMLFENNKTIINRFIKGTTGTLKTGGYADIIILGYNPPTPINADTVSSHLLFGVSGRSVDTTIINGNVRMLDRKLADDIDEERIMAKSREQAAALWGRI